MKENTLYYTEDYVQGMLTDSDVKNCKQVDINGSELRNLLHDNISDEGHRCISVYRHAFVLNSHTYNICLSCGDFYRDNKHYYLKNVGQIRDYINNIISADKK